MNIEGETDNVVADASAAPVADTGKPEVVTDPDTVALEAFKEGAADPAAAEKPTPKVEAPVAEAAKPVVDAPVDPKVLAEAEAKAATDAIEAEITANKMKPETAKRFRELASRLPEDKVAPLRAASERLANWEKTIHETFASPQQLGELVNYTTMVNKANAGDMTAAQAAFTRAQDEVKHWAKLLGKEAPGVDPLADHKDLQEAVEAGDTTRALALELANQRAIAARQTEASQRTAAQTQKQQEFEAAKVDAIKTLTVMGDTLKGADPAYLQKIANLGPAIKLIQENLHPSQWAAAFQKAYSELPAIADPTPKPAAVGPVPLRPTGAGGNGQIREPKTDLEAFQMGVQSLAG